MSTSRNWIYRALTLGGVGLFVYTWFQPWWQAFIVELKVVAVTIRPWGLVSNMPIEYSQWLVGADMPAFFAPAMWAYLGVALFALLFSLFVSDDLIGFGKFKMSLQKALIGAVGLSYIVFVVTCVAIISIRAREFYGASLMGTVFVSMSDHEQSNVDTGLLLGYWLAAGAGPLLVGLALLREKIIGEPSQA